MDHHIAELDSLGSWFAAGLTLELDPTLTVDLDRGNLPGEPPSTMRATRPRDARSWPGHACVAQAAGEPWTYTVSTAGALAAVG